MKFQSSRPSKGELDTLEFERNILSTAKGGGIAAVGRLFNYLSRILITLLLARLLDAEQYGLYNLALSAAVIAGALALFGLDTGLTRYIAIMNSREDEDGLWGALQVGLGLSVALSVVTSTGLFALAYPLAQYAFHDLRLVPLLQAASLIVPFLTLSDVLAGATRGFKSMRDMVLAQNITQPAVRLVLIAILALSGLNMLAAIIVYGVADASASFLLLYFLNKRFSLKRPLRMARRNTQEFLRFSLPLWLSDLMSTFRGNIQTLLIGSLNTARGVGIFAVATQLNLIGHIFHYAVTISARPLIAELSDRGDYRSMGRLYQLSTKWVLTLNLPLILIMMLFPAPVMSIFGKSFTDGATALVILGFVNLVNVGTGMCGAIIEMTGYTRLKLINSAIRLGSSILFNLLFIPRWGIVGAALAALCLELVSNFLPLIQVWRIFKVLPYNRSFTSPLVAGAISALAAWMFSRLLPAEAGLLNLGANLLVLASVYTVILFALGFSQEDQIVLKRLRKRAGLLFLKG